MQKKISIFGSTGSIGTQTLDIIEKYPEFYKAEVLTTNTKVDLLAQQIDKFKPSYAVICNETAYSSFVKKHNYSNTKILPGRQSLLDIASQKYDLVISALVGFSGVEPTYKAIQAGNDVALANKETLVAAGKFITKKVKEKNVRLIAVDSEHSAILQCLVGENQKSIEKLILTASGGPFRDTPIEEFKNITIKDALNHPNWSMGSKVTIDSASMMNKGLELIEAMWLFDIDPKRLDVLVHKESIIHSLVQFKDRSVKAQLGLPDMRGPISYAMSYPERLKFDFPELNLSEISTLNFEKADLNKFQCLKIAIDIMQNEPHRAVIMNAANEIAVENFLTEKISFQDIPKFISMALNKTHELTFSSLDELIEVDTQARVITNELINN